MNREKRKRTNHTREFKVEAVRLTLNSEVSLTQVAAELGISPSNLRRWKREYVTDAHNAFPGPG